MDSPSEINETFTFNEYKFLFYRLCFIMKMYVWNENYMSFRIKKNNKTKQWLYKEFYI